MSDMADSDRGGLGGSSPRASTASARIAVRKTYKLYIGGAFPR